VAVAKKDEISAKCDREYHQEIAGDGDQPILTRLGAVAQIPVDYVKELYNGQAVEQHKKELTGDTAADKAKEAKDKAEDKIDEAKETAKNKAESAKNAAVAKKDEISAKCDREYHQEIAGDGDQPILSRIGAAAQIPVDYVKELYNGQAAEQHKNELTDGSAAEKAKKKAEEAKEKAEDKIDVGKSKLEAAKDAAVAKKDEAGAKCDKEYHKTIAKDGDQPITDRVAAAAQIPVDKSKEMYYGSKYETNKEAVKS